MFTIKDILETNQMITQNNLDVRTITMGISLRDCGHPDIKVTAQKVYDKITRKAEKLVQVGEELEMELGVPIINKRISVTPLQLLPGLSWNPAAGNVGRQEAPLILPDTASRRSCSIPTFPRW